MNQKVLLLTAAISGFVFLVSFATLYAQTHIVDGTACSCKLPIPNLIPVFSSLGIFIGILVYYFLQPLKYSNIKPNFIADLLESDEAKIVEVLLDKKETSQAELSKQLGRVRCFRAVERLRRRGVVEKEKKGRTYVLRFSKKFRRNLFNE